MTSKPRASRYDPDHLYRLSSRLTDRDRYLCRLLYDHRVLTTAQVENIAFTGRRTCEQRLATLHGMGVVDRFRQRGDNHTPYHYTLGPAGAFVIAAERGVEVAELAWRRERACAWAYSSRLAHLVGVNGFFTALIAHGRHGRHARLAEWLSEWQCASRWGTHVRPDGYGEWAERGGQIPFFLEYDMGTERTHRLVAKMEGYANLAGAIGRSTWVLFAFSSARREAEARKALGRGNTAVATSVTRSAASPADAIWLPIRITGPRVPLIGLGDPDRPGVNSSVGSTAPAHGSSPRGGQ